jgi:hypothetical protein
MSIFDVKTFPNVERPDPHAISLLCRGSPVAKKKPSLKSISIQHKPHSSHVYLNLSVTG